MDEIVKASRIWRVFFHGADIEDIFVEVLLQITEREGQFYERLHGVEDWARARLPSIRNDGNADNTLEVDVANCAYMIRVLERSARAVRRKDRGNRAPLSSSVQDYLKYRRGAASEACIDRVRAQLDDPLSELSRTLGDVTRTKHPGLNTTEELAVSTIGRKSDCLQQAKLANVPCGSDARCMETGIKSRKASCLAGAVAATPLAGVGPVIAVIAACVSNWIRLLDNSHDDKLEELIEDA